MLKKKWWEKRAHSNSGWCVVKVEQCKGYVYQASTKQMMLEFNIVYKPCHASNLPTGVVLLSKDLKKDEAVSLSKLLNTSEESNHDRQ